MASGTVTTARRACPPRRPPWPTMGSEGAALLLTGGRLPRLYCRGRGHWAAACHAAPAGCTRRTPPPRQRQPPAADDTRAAQHEEADRGGGSGSDSPPRTPAAIGAPPPAPAPAIAHPPRPPQRPRGNVQRRADGHGAAGGVVFGRERGPRSSPATGVGQRGRLRQGPRRPRGRPAWRRRLCLAAGPARGGEPRRRCRRGTATAAPPPRRALPDPPSCAPLLATYPPPTTPPPPATGAWHAARAAPIDGSRPRPRQHRRGEWCLSSARAQQRRAFGASGARCCQIIWPCAEAPRLFPPTSATPIYRHGLGDAWEV